MTGSKVRVQIIGNYLEPLEKLLNDRSIAVDSIISKCNPLAMTGKTDISYIEYAEKSDTKMLSVLNIRKNLNQMLSRDPEIFCQNYNVQPLGKEVRYKNDTSYIVVSNSGIALTLFEKNGIIFSYSWPEDDFIHALVADKGYNKLSFPFPEEFNIRFYYDNFINSIIKEYDKDHIILIKTNVSQWYLNKDEITPFDRKSAQIRRCINEMDEYFIQATHCCVIDDEFNYIPPERISCSVPYVQKSNYAYERIADRISDIIHKNIMKQNPVNYWGNGSLVGILNDRLSSDILDANKENLNYIENRWLSLRDIKEKDLQRDNAFFANVLKLERFLAPNKSYTLSDYVNEKINSKNCAFDFNDFNMAELYAEYMKLDINDLIAIYILLQRSDDTSLYKKIVEKICCSNDCLPLKAAAEQKKSNIDILKGYPFINKDWITDNSSAVYVPLKKGLYLVLDPETEKTISMTKIDFCDEPDSEKIIENGYICSVLEADALTYCIDYYVEKAKRNFGAEPTFLRFESFEEFDQSLNFINYKALLENERFVFEINGSRCNYTEKYTAITDLTELMDKDLVTVRVSNGLGDQLGYYILGQLIEDHSNRKVLYDNTSCRDFNGFEIHKFAKRNLNVLTDLISKRILDCVGYESFKRIYCKISKKYTAVTWDYDYRYKRFASGSPCLLTRDIYQAVTTNMPYSYYLFWLAIDDARTQFDFNLRDYIEFPEFTDTKHKELSEKMLSCDAVVIHVRRGDYVNKGWSANDSFYANTIRGVMGLKQYTQKKFFVFSDDIKWCKEHKKDIGLDQVGECEIIFAEGNKYENSFRDIQLMSLGKIMIIGTSYFSRIAALYSDTWEMFFSSSEKICKQFEEKIRKNRYNIDVVCNENSTASKQQSAHPSANTQPPRV